MVDKAEKEIWKTYPDPKYNFIEASNLGRIRTKDRYVPGRNGSKRLIKGRVLKQQLNPNGYMYVTFKVNGKTVNLSVHRVIASSHLPNPDNLPEVNHKDNDPINNAVSNLEWCSRKYNEAYKKNFGTVQAEVFGRPVFAVDLETSKILRFETQTEAARQLGVGVRSINDVLKGRQKTTHDWWFCYADENAVKKVRAKFGDKAAEKVEELIGQNQK